jgi:hypothetical protein
MRITTVCAREMPYPKEDAVAAIREIKNIERTEVKADAVVVSPESPSSGTYKVRGRFARVPWRGEFAYSLNDAGFHSRNAGMPAEDATIEGGFVVTPLADGCTVIHYEQYVLTPWLVPLKHVLRLYLRWSMARELHDLDRLIANGGGQRVASSVSSHSSNVGPARVVSGPGNKPPCS